MLVSVPVVGAPHPKTSRVYFIYFQGLTDVEHVVYLGVATRGEFNYQHLQEVSSKLSKLPLDPEKESSMLHRLRSQVFNCWPT